MSYCPHHDPLLRAGVLHCLDCHRVTYPTDACWVDEGKLLAVYPRACAHEPGGALVVDVTRMGTTPVDFDPELYATGRKCLGVNSAGRPCRAYAVPGSHYCYQHADQGREAR